ncbi:hypothetical protein EV198_2651 [Roseivirga ehrenbergii]|uniref:Right handed beta helix domain-containing protein n=1 Tax=Roseivirga ehrenbergii (strain DSM 102268 / JCM 13514 / KCTC 12282 / NCIMB 14502 / KMM 6017) TaxID=279360 RepID=A0A150XTH4_ROSEK|nr:hypothetical protein [Roseivirga ehrenbergii]KYG82040.1 hypothetical protein MB14_01200 [Roseivirga ehrenbergii]TCL01861.1 hypothetical protein EV198_2651 [Roseivirga ehrenbergii]
MRALSQSNFLKIIEGKDYDFLINGFAFSLKESVHLSNGQFHSPHIYHFKNCRFPELVVSESDISSHWIFENCQFNEVAIESSRVANIEFENCVISDLVYKFNPDAGALRIHACKIDHLEYLSNSKFHSLHIGCNNLLDKVNILNNGIDNTSTSEFYLCPEKFNAIRVERLTASKMEIGTFGEYSNLFLNEIHADHLLLRNCHSKNSKVVFKKIKPKSESGGLLQLLDSTIGASVFEDDFFKSFFSVEYKNSTIDNYAL